MKKIFRFCFDKNYRFLVLSNLGFYKSLDDKVYLERLFKALFNKNLDLNNPLTYNEKVQWLKLYDRKDIYTEMVDKYAAKQFVSRILGEKYIIPTLGIYDDVNQIDFNKLPNSFVMKCTHDSGGVVICKDKNAFDINGAKKYLRKMQKKDFYLKWREWPYKNVPHRIIVEEYMEDKDTQEIRDYKFFTFGGKVKAMFIASERQNSKVETKFDFFDENFKHLPITNGHPNAPIEPKKPINFELMKEFAEKLSAGTRHLRVDFYEINGSVYFGEMTFYHWSGLVPFEPEEWDGIFGSWIKLK